MTGNSDKPLEAFPAFRPRPPWWGGDLQTLRNTFALRFGLLDTDMPGVRLELPTRDNSGDRLIAVLNEGREGRPLAVLAHGLTGCHFSSYMVGTARYLNALGYPVLRLNLRGAGPSAALCRQRYHAGRGADIADALTGLDPVRLRDGAIFVGYSLGGNILLNFLAEHGGDFPVRAAATISAPIDLAAASRRMAARRNRLYDSYLVRRMKADWAGVVLDEAARAALAAVQTVYAFDDRLVAPHNGFGNAPRYYADCSALRIMHRIGAPTLLLHAANDPWIPADSYRQYDWTQNARLTPLIASGGGHVGFHDRAAPPAWHDRCLGQWFGTH